VRDERIATQKPQCKVKDVETEEKLVIDGKIVRNQNRIDLRRMTKEKTSDSYDEKTYRLNMFTGNLKIPCMHSSLYKVNKTEDGWDM
jgi:hypothetical protein